jgi:hypothetical protein
VTSTAHGFVVGQRVYISGANQAEYNGRYTVVTATADTFTYTFAGSATTPATGTILAWQAAMSIKVGAGDARHSFMDISGTATSACEVDLNSRGAMVLGDHVRCLYARVSNTLTTVIAQDTEAKIFTPTLAANAITERTSGGGITVGGGSAIATIFKVQFAVDLPSIAAATGLWHVVACTGVLAGDLVFVLPANGPGGTTDKLIIGQCWVSNTDEVTIPIYNSHSSAVDSTNRTWYACVVRFV